MHIGMSSSTHFAYTGYISGLSIPTCGTQPDGNTIEFTTSCSAFASSISRSAPMMSFGFTDMPSTKRSGYRRCASSPFVVSPTRAIVMLNASIFSTTHSTTSVPSSTTSGTPLKMYWTGNSISC